MGEGKEEMKVSNGALSGGRKILVVGKQGGREERLVNRDGVVILVGVKGGVVVWEKRD